MAAAADLKGFNILFVEQCGKEHSLYNPKHSKDPESAVRRISDALIEKGFPFASVKVKPLFKRVRGLYEAELDNRTKGGYSDLEWFHAMDVYMRPFVRSGSDASPSSNPETEEATEGNKSEEEDDTPCDVCRSALPEDKNEMIYCNLCNVCVHQACYGVPVVPEDDWFCRPCQLKKKPSCALCPKDGGAMKCTSDQQWAHVSCAWWIKEVKFDDPEKMEPIDISKIPVGRWNLVCSLCRNKHGACIQCMVSSCTVAYHVTCAFDKGLTMDMRDEPDKEDGVELLSYCRKHSLALNTPKSEKKRKQKKRTRRGSRDVRNKIRSPSRQMSTSETTWYGNELSDTGSTSDSSSRSSGIDSSTTQSSVTSGCVCEDNTLIKKKASKPLNRDKNGNKKMLNSDTTITRKSFEGHPNEMQNETRRGKRSFHRRTSFNEDPSAKRVRFLELSSKQLPSTENEPINDCIPVTATQETRISCDNNDSHRILFSFNVSSAKQSKPQDSFSLHSPETKRDHLPSPLTDQSTAIQTKNCSSFKNECNDIYSHSSREQPSSSIKKETTEPIAEERSETVNYEQLTKFITAHLKSVSSIEAKRLERKIVSLCLKSRRTNVNLSKINPS